MLGGPPERNVIPPIIPREIFAITKQIIPISDYYEIQRRKLIIDIIQATNDNLIRRICADLNLELVQYTGKRVGRPQNNRWIIGIVKFWEFLRRRQTYIAYRWTTFDSNSHDYIAVQYQAAHDIALDITDVD